MGCLHGFGGTTWLDRSASPPSARRPSCALSAWASRASVAARAAGCSKDTIRRRLQRKPAFLARVEEAEGQAQQMLLNLVLGAAAKKLPNTWQAAAWMLERRWPDLYGQRNRIEISLDVRREAKRIADELGISVEEVLAEADAILAQGHAGGEEGDTF